MTWNEMMGLISTIALSLPIIMIIATKLPAYKSFPALALYYLIVVTYNLLTEGYIKASPGFIDAFGIANNLMDAPLMLTFLTYFTSSLKLKNRMRMAIGAFMLFELITISVTGFNVKAITIIMGPGILLVMVFCIGFFVRQIKIAITMHKASGKAIITASLLFAYGCYSIIYIVYYIMESKDVENTFLVYFIVSTFSSVLMSIGIYVERKRIRKLTELKLVRKELSAIYGEEKSTPLRPAGFDFDKKQWN